MPLAYVDAGTGASVAAAFALRGAMDLVATTADDANTLLAMLPADCATRVAAGGIASVAYGDLAKIVLPLVSVSPAAAHLCVGGTYFNEAAWNRWWGVLLQLVQAQRGSQADYPAYLLAAMEARDEATDAQKQALTLQATDLETSESNPVDNNGVASADTRDFLMDLTYGDMTARGRLLPLARLLHGLGCHAGHVFRDSVAFRRGMHILRQTAAAATGIVIDDLEPREIAEAAAGALRTYAWGPEFEHLGSELGAAKWSQLRLELVLGQPAEWSKAATRARLLAERFHGVTGCTRFRPVEALTCGNSRGAQRSLTSPEACAMAEEVAVRSGLVRPGEPFTAEVLAMLATKLSHMTEALLAQPWVGRTPRERAEHVVELLWHAEANKASADAMRLQLTGRPGESKDKLEAAKGQGTIPKHFQANVAPAMLGGAYRDLKAAALSRLSQGGAAAELDALQTLCTGVITLPLGGVMPRQWSALMTLVADGPQRGVNAELFDEEAAVFSSISRRRYAELLGRTLGLQLSVDKTTTHSNLEGYQDHHLDAALAKEDWSTVDFGHAYLCARGALRVGPELEVPAAPYTTPEDIDNALTVAAPALALKGFPGTGEGTFPYALQQVRETWRLYGGGSAHVNTSTKLAEQGRAYLVAFLVHLGQTRHNALSGKNPLARPLEQGVPSQAHAAFQRHCERLEAALAMGGYFAYTEHAMTTPTSSPAGKAKAKPAEPASQDKDTGKVSVKVDWRGGEGVARVVGPGGRSFVVSLPLLLERAAAGQRACVAGMIGSAWGKAYEKALCKRTNCGGNRHQWKNGTCALRKCEVSSSKKRAAGANDEGASPPEKKKKANPKPTSTAVDDEEDDDGGEGEGDDQDDDTQESAGKDEGDATQATSRPSPKKPNGARGSGGRGRGANKGRGGGGRQQATAVAEVGVTAAAVVATPTPPDSQPDSSSTSAADVSAADVSAADNPGEDESVAMTARLPEVKTGVRPPPRSSPHRQWFRAGTTFVASSVHGQRSPAVADTSKLSGWTGPGGGYVMRSTLMVAALLATPNAPRTLAIGDRRGRIRDASNAAGQPALSCDLAPCESGGVGFSYEGDGRDLDGMTTWNRLFTNMPCEQQSISLGRKVAAIKALDGRMWWGQAAWLRMWCIKAACVVAEQPDSYIADFYDAQYVVTSPSEWGGHRQKTTLLFFRGTAAPRPPQPGRQGSASWHNEGCADRSGDAVARARDDLGPEMAKGLVSQVAPTGVTKHPQFGVEIERLAAAWWTVGLPLPHDYAHPTGAPCDEADHRQYARCRGEGDGRRLPGTVIPSMIACPEKWVGVSIPEVTERGRGLGRAAVTLREADAKAARRPADDPTNVPHLADQTRSCCLRVLPARSDGERLWFLLPLAGGTIGAVLAAASGRTAAQRKQTTAAATAIARLIYPQEKGASSAAVHCAPAAFSDASEAEGAVCVALVPPDLVGSQGERSSGCVWRMRARPQDKHTARAIAISRWYILGWRRPQLSVGAEWRTGAVPAASTERGQQQPAARIDSGRAARLLKRDLALLSSMLDAAAEDGELRSAASDMLHAWAQKAGEQPAAAVLPPDTVLRDAARPDCSRLESLPFLHRCKIPTTQAVEPSWKAPRWPPGVPRPKSFLDTYKPHAADEVRRQWQMLTHWNRDRLAGGTARRPEARSWSDAARLPWFQGWVQDFKSGDAEALDGRGTAAPVRIHSEAALWYWRDYPHRKLLSFIIHGVMLQREDEMPLQTTLAPPLFALYDVEGGADAVVNELHSLERDRGWYVSGSAPLTSPARCTPRSATERVGGPPRGLAEQGWPRKQHTTADCGEAVESLNYLTGKHRAAARGDLFYPLDERKPRMRDACINAMILWVPAQMLDVSLILITFDYKYFFHHLVYAAREVWKLAFVLPGRCEAGGADGEVLRVLHELVMSMGWTRASLIAQELADAIIWKLLRLVDSAIAEYVETRRRAQPAFDKWWVRRLAMAHDDYGTQARLHDSLQYTDDKFGVCVGPVVAAHFLACFSRLIGPAYVPSADAAMAARATVANLATRAGCSGSPAPPLPRDPRPPIVALSAACPEVPGHTTYPVRRLSALANPFAARRGGTPSDAIAGFACLCACALHSSAAEVGSLLGLTVDAAQGAISDKTLASVLDDLAERVHGGEAIALRCRQCKQPCRRDMCHVPTLAMVILQRATVRGEAERGPPSDPVTTPPVPRSLRAPTGASEAFEVERRGRQRLDRQGSRCEQSGRLGSRAQSRARTARHSDSIRRCLHGSALRTPGGLLGRPRRSHGWPILSHEGDACPAAAWQRSRRRAQRPCGDEEANERAAHCVAPHSPQLPGDVDARHVRGRPGTCGSCRRLGDRGRRCPRERRDQSAHRSGRLLVRDLLDGADFVHRGARKAAHHLPRIARGGSGCRAGRSLALRSSTSTSRKRRARGRAYHTGRHTRGRSYQRDQGCLSGGHS